MKILFLHLSINLGLDAGVQMRKFGLAKSYNEHHGELEHIKLAMPIEKTLDILGGSRFFFRVLFFYFIFSTNARHSYEHNISNEL